MKRRKFARIFRQSFKIAGADKLFYVYFAYFVVSAVILWIVEPSMETFADGLWYCFAVATTIGFGDITAVSAPGRILTVILSVYSLAAVAIFTAVITSFFMDIARMRAEDSAKEFLDDIEHLPELSREELEDLSKRIRKFLANR